MPGAAMNVQIDVSGSDGDIPQIGNGNSSGHFTAFSVGDFEDATVLNEQQWMLDDLHRSEQFSSTKCQHRIVLIAAKDDCDQDCSSPHTREEMRGLRNQERHMRTHSETSRAKIVHVAECYTVKVRVAP